PAFARITLDLLYIGDPQKGFVLTRKASPGEVFGFAAGTHGDGYVDDASAFFQLAIRPSYIVAQLARHGRIQDPLNQPAGFALKLCRLDLDGDLAYAAYLVFEARRFYERAKCVRGYAEAGRHGITCSH